MPMQEGLKVCQDSMCSLFQHLTALENLSITAHREVEELFPNSSRLFQSIHTTRLISLRLTGVTIDISQAWLASLQELRKLSCEYSWVDFIQQSAGKTPLPHLESLEYMAPHPSRMQLHSNGRRLEKLTSAFPVTSLGRLKHFIFTSPYDDDYAVASSILTAVATHLETFTYILPSGVPAGPVSAVEETLSKSHSVKTADDVLNRNT